MMIRIMMMMWNENYCHDGQFLGRIFQNSGRSPILSHVSAHWDAILHEHITKYLTTGDTQLLVLSAWVMRVMLKVTDQAG